MKHIIAIFLSLLLFSSAVLASPHLDGEYYVKNIGIAENLSQSSVTCIIYDDYSSLWIGTRYGLNEYRNHRMRTFGDDYVNCLFLDRDKILWYGSNQGLYKYQRDQDIFEKQSDKTVFCLSQDADGTVLIGCSGGLLRIRNNEQTFFPLDASMIGGIYSFRDKHLLIDKGSGLYLFENDSISHVAHSEIDGSVVLATACHEGILYLSLFRKGVLALNLESEQYNYLDRTELDSDIVLCLQFIGDELWMGSDGQGIYIYDTKDFSIRKQDIPSNSITAIYGDPFMNVWAGTVRSGIYGLRPSPFLSFNASVNTSSDDVIISFCRSGEDILWIGTDGDGIRKFDIQEKSIQAFEFTRGLKISSLAYLDKGLLLASVYGQGLKVIDVNEGKISSLTIINEETNKRECYYGNAPQLYNLDNGHVLIMAINVYDYNPLNGQFSRYSPGDNPMIAEMHLLSEDYAYTYNSLFRIDTTARSLVRLEPDFGEKKINSAAQIRDSIWIGTNYGLLCYSISDGRIEECKTRMFNRVSWLQAAGEDLWIAADNTLFRRHKGKLEMMGENEGIAANEILTGLCDDKNLYLGGTKGLIRINRERGFEEKSPYSQKLQILSINMGGKKIKVEDNRVKLPSSFPAITINFGLSMVDPFDRYVYRYVVAGNTTYSVETYEDFLVLHDLKSGRYDISVSALGPDGSWSEEERLLQITVLRPWYSQIWFKVLLSAILLSLAVYLVLRLVRKKMKKMEQQMRAMNSVFMNKLDSFIEENISNSSLDIAMITSNMTMSRASLYNKVKEITGKGIWEYIEDIRINKACKLLRETTLPIAEIAEQCGFGSSHYFSTRFKKLCSCTPREYRHDNSSK